MLRCWQRGIYPELLSKVLRKIKIVAGERVVIATPETLRGLGTELPQKANNHCLVVIVKGNCVKTAYFLEKLNNKFNNPIEIL